VIVVACSVERDVPAVGPVGSGRRQLRPMAEPSHGPGIY
jgi:hypothetical protein